jgi:hypothetical protein
MQITWHESISGEILFNNILMSVVIQYNHNCTFDVIVGDTVLYTCNTEHQAIDKANKYIIDNI